MNTNPDGTISTSLRKTNESITTTAPDKTVTTTTQGPDPRFGMFSPVPKTRIVKTPSGLTSVTATTRTATLADPTNPLSLTTQTEQVTRNGRTSTSVYTAGSRTLAATSPAGRQTTSTLDTQGRPLQTQVTGLSAIQYAYDSRGRLTALTQGSGADARTSAIAYNPQGYADAFIDPAGQVTRFSYDPAGRVTRQTLPDGRIIAWSYDANGNVIGITPPSRPPHTFSYTPVDLEERYSPPSAGLPVAHTQYAYNLDKQLTTITRPDGQTVALAYDSGGRLSTMTLPTGTVTSGYSATTGKLTSINTSQGIGLSYTHDGFLPVSKTYSGPITGVVTRSYNNDFNVTSISVNGSAIVFTYDADNLLAQVGNLSISRDVQNGLITGTALNSVATSQTYNAFGEINRFTASQGATALFDVQTTRDKLSRITQKTETLGATTDVYGYTYDPAERLAEVMLNGAVQTTYTYDSNGNRATKTTSSGTVLGSYDDQDRLLAYGNSSYSYTENGELRTKTNSGQTTTYTYDVLGNLANVTLPNGTAIEYVIDGRNRRIGKKVNGSLTQGFLYQDQLKPIAELDSSGNVVARFVYGTSINIPDYLIKGANTYRIISDHLGSPRLIINTQTGTIEQRLDYDEFGNITRDTNPGFQPFGFAGGLYDRDTKLTRFGARDYDPETGRWTAKDPIRFDSGDTNLYGYVLNDPINWIDPSGKVGLKQCTKVIAKCGECIESSKKCREEHGDPVQCLERGENPGISVGAHLASRCFFGNPKCEGCTVDLIACGLFAPVPPIKGPDIPTPKIPEPPKESE